MTIIHYIWHEFIICVCKCVCTVECNTLMHAGKGDGCQSCSDAQLGRKQSLREGNCTSNDCNDSRPEDCNDNVKKLNQLEPLSTDNQEQLAIQ